MNMWINLCYLVASALFIFGLKLLGSPEQARKGNILSSVGMLIAVCATVFHQEIIDYPTILSALVIGSLIGVYSAKKVAMTSMPQMVALLNGFGGLSSLLVGIAAQIIDPSITTFMAATIFISVLIGGITFTGSIIAWAKLSEKIAGKPFIFRGQKLFNLLLAIALLASGVIFSLTPSYENYLFASIVLSFLLGIFIVLPIGGADMPVVISLLNSYSGLAACAAGFVMQNNLLIISGALVGASGIILTSIMCKAMNRSLSNVLFSGFGGQKSKGSSAPLGQMQSLLTKNAYHVLEAARSVVIIPGYGLAVAQAQHAVKELCQILQKNGADVIFAIHSVAGRMPGHMNVLLAEAGVSYELLAETDDVNPMMNTVDVCLVIGANDVVNPSARDDKTSPIYGMPIIQADLAKHVFILKRSKATGFAGIENPLFYKNNTSMIFGDAKKTLQDFITEFKS